MNMQATNERLTTSDTINTLAASVTERTAELLSDGWMQGALSNGVEAFCIHGAMALALDEVFGQSEDCGRAYVCGGVAAQDRGKGRAEVEAVATAFIVDEAASKYGFDPNSWKQGFNGAASFNDDPTRQQHEVLDVVSSAAEKLWSMTLDAELAIQKQVSYIELDSEEDVIEKKIQKLFAFT